MPVKKVSNFLRFNNSATPQFYNGELPPQFSQTRDKRSSSIFHIEREKVRRRADAKAELSYLAVDRQNIETAASKCARISSSLIETISKKQSRTRRSSSKSDERGSSRHVEIQQPTLSGRLGKRRIQPPPPPSEMRERTHRSGSKSDKRGSSRHVEIQQPTLSGRLGKRRIQPPPCPPSEVRKLHSYDFNYYSEGRNRSEMSVRPAPAFYHFTQRPYSGRRLRRGESSRLSLILDLLSLGWLVLPPRPEQSFGDSYSHMRANQSNGSYHMEKMNSRPSALPSDSQIKVTRTSSKGGTETMIIRDCNFQPDDDLENIVLDPPPPPPSPQWNCLDLHNPFLLSTSSVGSVEPPTSNDSYKVVKKKHVEEYNAQPIRTKNQLSSIEEEQLAEGIPPPPPLSPSPKMKPQIPPALPELPSMRLRGEEDTGDSNNLDSVLQSHDNQRLTSDDDSDGASRNPLKKKKKRVSFSTDTFFRKEEEYIPPPPARALPDIPKNVKLKGVGE